VPLECSSSPWKKGEGLDDDQEEEEFVYVCEGINGKVIKHYVVINHCSVE